jgi:hypothetical protein
MIFAMWRSAFCKEAAFIRAKELAYKNQPHPDFGVRPKWRKEPKRNTCRALVGLLRACLLENPELLSDLGLTIPMISAILRQAALKNPIKYRSMIASRSILKILTDLRSLIRGSFCVV